MNPTTALLPLFLLLVVPAPAVQAGAAGGEPESGEPDPPEAVSLLGEPLHRPELPADLLAERRRQLAEAEARHAADPGDADALIWLGRRTAYLGRYRASIDLFSRGVELHPDDPRFLRHRGHRHLTVRRLDLAIADLERAAAAIRGTPDEIEPDGLPNALGIPTSTLHSNIWYHLGLAHYLDGDFEAALAAYRECREVSDNPDMLVATTYWLALTLGRLGRDEEMAAALAAIGPEVEVIENEAYLRLIRLYQGASTTEELLAAAGDDPGSLDFATIAYGVGARSLLAGRTDEAEALFGRVVAGGQWPAFGHLAAEAELARGGRQRTVRVPAGS